MVGQLNAFAKTVTVAKHQEAKHQSLQQGYSVCEELCTPLHRETLGVSTQHQHVMVLTNTQAHGQDMAHQLYTVAAKYQNTHHGVSLATHASCFIQMAMLYAHECNTYSQAVSVGVLCVSSPQRQTQLAGDPNKSQGKSVH